METIGTENFEEESELLYFISFHRGAVSFRRIAG